MSGRVVLGFNFRFSLFWVIEIFFIFFGEMGIRKRLLILFIFGRKRRVRDGRCLWAVEEDEGY